VPQKECFHSQQELTTILFEERGNDVDLQGDNIHSFSPTSWEAGSIQTHAWRNSFWALTFEFHDKRHFMEFYSNYKVSFPEGDIKWGSKHCIVKGMMGIKSKTSPQARQPKAQARRQLSWWPSMKPHSRPHPGLDPSLCLWFLNLQEV